MLDKLSACNNKLGLVETLKEYGIRTTTKPKEKVTVDDQYFQLEDGSRIQIHPKKSSFGQIRKSVKVNISKNVIL